MSARENLDRKSTRLNSSHTVIYTLSLHDALPISSPDLTTWNPAAFAPTQFDAPHLREIHPPDVREREPRSEEHTSELQSHRDLHSFPTRRSSDLFSGFNHLESSSVCADAI